jgi:branched-chain amino acid aminotransferase
MSVVWCNGEFQSGQLRINRHERGLLLGDGIFETLLVLGGVALWCEQHLERMAGAAGELGLPFDRSLVQQAVAAVLQGATPEPQVLRLTLTRGAAARGLAGDGAEPHLLITLDPFAAALIFQPCRLQVARIRRNEFAPSSRLKTTSYIDAIAAAREVADVADDAVMLNSRGAVASTTIANLFLIRGNDLITPARDQGLLPGIMRGLVLAHAAAIGLTPCERPVALDDLTSADSIFLTNSLRLLRPVTSLNGKALSGGGARLVQDLLCRLTQDHCGISPANLV